MIPNGTMGSLWSPFEERDANMWIFYIMLEAILAPNGTHLESEISEKCQKRVLRTLFLLLLNYT